MESTVKIAITTSLFPNTGAPKTHLVQISKSATTNSILSTACQLWDVKNSDIERYCLKYDPSKKYLTESSKADLADGSILQLCHAPNINAERHLTALKNNIQNEGQRLRVCSAMQKAAADEKTAYHLSQMNALNLIVSYLDCPMFLLNRTPENLGNEQAFNLSDTYKCVEAMLSVITDLIRADQIYVLSSGDDIKSLVRLVTLYLDHNNYPENNVYNVIASSLFILESIARTKQEEDVLGKELIPIEALVKPLFNYGSNVKFGSKVASEVISSFNTIYTLSSDRTQERMRQVYVEKRIHRTIYDSLLRGGQKVSSEVSHQLYLMQIILMNGFYGHLMCKIDAQDHNSLEYIKELRKIAFDHKKSGMHLSQQTQRAGRFSEDYKVLGFTSHLDPSQDFQKSSTGSLALNLMTYFARKYPEKYISFVLDDSNYCGEGNECPFAACSIRLVELICGILKIGSSTQKGPYLPMFFSVEDFLGEFFCICIQHLLLTWKEMRAKIEDLDKVIEVSKEQISGSLKQQQQLYLKLDEFRNGLKPYIQVSESWRENAKAKSYADAPAIQELRSILKPDILNLIERQRLAFLVEGAKFYKLKKDGGRERNKFTFCKLSPNHKNVYYGDWNDTDSIPTLENLPNKLLVSDMQDLILPTLEPTSQSTNLRDLNKMGNKFRDPISTHSNLTLTIMSSSQPPLDLVALDQKTFDYWCDGIHALIRKEMKSPKVTEEYETLMGLEVKLKLLHLNGFDDFHTIPKLPPPPSNYNFCQR